MTHRVPRRRFLSTRWLPALTVLLFAAQVATMAQLPPGTYVFASDFIGSSNQIYDDDSERNLVEGWIGFRDPLGDHGGTPAFTTVGAGLLTYQGGQLNFSDALTIRNTLSGVPPAYLLEVRFRRDTDHGDERFDFVLDVGGNSYFVSGGPDSQSGRVGNTTPFPLTTGTWYTLQIVDSTISAPQGVQLGAGNFTAPQVTVDWIFINAQSGPAPQRGSSGFEFRIWEDGTSPPISPQVSGVASNGGPALPGLGNEPTVIPAMGTTYMFLLALLFASGTGFVLWRRFG